LSTAGDPEVPRIPSIRACRHRAAEDVIAEGAGRRSLRPAPAR